MPRDAAQLDSRLSIVTPENIAFEYQIAGPFARAPAYLVDFSICVVAVVACTMVAVLAFGAAGLWGLGFSVGLVVWFFLQWFYGGFFEATWNGQTPGKRMFGLRVLGGDGRPVTASQATLRNFVKLLDMAPFLPILPNVIELPTLLFGLGAMALTPRYQRLGDLVSNTIVVVEDRSRLSAAIELEDRRVYALAEAIPANFVASTSLAKALAHYSSRRRYFGPARRSEIARHLGEPLTERFRLGADTDHDLLMCALYVRTFHDQREQDAPSPAEALAASG
ncbi:RDD family protein [Pirellulimonas nuda]|uniref:RDD family protein n=1 Tax=Pirellulimonas nuda TaxID=2528009 RepID=A0A518DI65_9BACT|nr:RDD family protein [Pirellulimonas nuda]QDU91167.1 RDD family protein [Pirellulimonas nuda]